MASFTILTLGCRANQADSEALSRFLQGAGWRLNPVGQGAEVGIVNTCTVTAEADRKARQMVRRLLKSCQLVVVTGCGAAPKGGLAQSVAQWERVILLPPRERERILEYLPKPLRLSPPIPAPKTRARALLKVQEGCNHMCTFCIVPLVRGPLRSWKGEELLPQVERLQGEGYREIVLTGTHLALWGRDSASKLEARAKGREAPNFAQLVEYLIKHTQDVRYRVSSIEPMAFPRPLLELMAAYPERLCPHLHLVLQHASDKILRAMGRDYTLAQYDSLVGEFLERVPGGVLTTDILLGFPGEEESDLEILEDYLRRRPFYHLHVFPYSPRPGTVASTLPQQVPEALKRERVGRVIALGEECSHKVYDSFVGTERPILVERLSANDPQRVVGTADNFLTVEIPGSSSDLGRMVTRTIPRRLL